MSLSRLNKTFALSQSFWVIQEISTGNYIPEPKSIGKHLYYTQVNPTNKGVPRLFNNRPSAAKALGKYIEGIFKKDWEDGLECNSVPGRSRDRFQIVEVKIEEI